MISIFIVDDHKIVRQGFRTLLCSEPGFQVVGEAGDASQALQLISTLKPNIVITDLRMKGKSGIEVVRETMSRSPQTKCLILSMYGDESWVMAALDAGAKGYVLKESSGEDLIEAIQTVLSGRIFLSSPLSLAKIEENRNKIWD
jgi:DNA-binding NarL/FixJ family response regulator